MRHCMKLALSATILGQVTVVSGKRSHDRTHSELLDLASLERGRRVREKTPCADSVRLLRPGGHIGKYTLSECVGSGAYGMVWMANASDGSKPVVVKIPRGGDDLKEECLFSQMITRRDPEHFVDCLEVGTSSKGYHYMVQEKAGGKTFSEVQSTISGLVETISLWMQLFDANEKMSATSDEDQFKFINHDISEDNLIIDFDESGEPKVKFIDYGLGSICCMGGLPTDCQASLRNGSTVNTSQLKEFLMCENLPEFEREMIKVQSILLALTATSSLDKDKIEEIEEFEEIVKSPWKVVPCVFREQVSIANTANPVIHNRVSDILGSIFAIAFQGNTSYVPALPRKLREVHEVLKDMKHVLAQTTVNCNSSM